MINLRGNEGTEVTLYIASGIVYAASTLKRALGTMFAGTIAYNKELL